MKFIIKDATPAGSQALDKCIKTITSLPDGELLTARGLAAKTHFSFRTIDRYSPQIPNNLRTQDKTRTRYFYGNQNTIRAFRRSA